MKTIIAAAALSATVLVSACSSTPKLSPTTPYDMSLNCAQIAAEQGYTSEVLRKADRNQGVSTANVAAFLVFWPAIIGNYMEASKAEDLAMSRSQNLNYLAQRQGCYGGPALRGYGAPTHSANFGGHSSYSVSGAY